MPPLLDAKITCCVKQAVDPGHSVIIRHGGVNTQIARCKSFLSTSWPQSNGTHAKCWSTGCADSGMFSIAIPRDAMHKCACELVAKLVYRMWLRTTSAQQ